MTKKFNPSNLVERVVAYPDKVRVWFKEKLEVWELDTIDSLCAHLRNSSSYPTDKNHEWMKLYGYLFNLDIAQPSDDLFRFLMKRFDTNEDYLINSVEFALDFITTTQRGADQLHDYYWARCQKKYHREEQGVRDYKGTSYMGPRNSEFSIYSDLMSRHWGDAYCCHIECRFQSQRKVRSKKLGIYTFQDLLEFNDFKFWEKTLVLLELDAEKIGKKINGIHLNNRSRVKCYGPVKWNVDSRTGGLLLRAFRYEFNPYDKKLQFYEELMNFLKFSKKWEIKLKLENITKKVEVTELIRSMRRPEVLARYNPL